MKIIRPKDSIQVSKPEGTDVTYFLRPEYEIHYNEQRPGTTQTWHHHEIVWETLFIIEGELTVKWKENNKEHEEIVRARDLIETEHTPHTFLNHTVNPVKFLVIKQILSGENKSELLKSDKIIDQ